MALHEGNTYRTIGSWLWRHILVGYLPEKKNNETNGEGNRHG